VVPKYFWKDAEHFYKSGKGFSLIYENRVASTAYSSFIHDNLLELGIETIESYRGKGFAVLTCSSLIDYCLNNNYEPVWACRLENVGSYNLAQKLGFEPTLYIPFYRLND
jgi:RimJ/RimL family protein N-acetyltransferase